jgi:hypothetical protein
MGGRKQLRPLSRYYHGICLGKLRELIKASVRIARLHPGFKMGSC